MKHILFVLCLAATIIDCKAAQFTDTLYINRGNLTMVDSTVLEVISVNHMPFFAHETQPLHLAVGDTAKIRLVNNDSITHHIKFEGDSSDWILNKGDTITLIRNFHSRGIFRLISSDEHLCYQGLHCLVIVDDAPENTKLFYWDLREFSRHWINNIENLNLEDSTNYEPEYFTINNLSFPATKGSSQAHVNAKKGESIRIYVYNSGLMDHNVHFHGYHVKILYSSEFPNHEGREKDSLPINHGQGIILGFTPHQSGKFPAHNHNLGATLGNNIYPNGMVTHITITD